MSVPCYRRQAVMPVDEDLLFEFKAHRQLSDSDLSSLSNTLTRDGSLMPKNPLRRVSISRTLCGMLNTGLGGTLFLGVTDAGRAEGFTLSRFQQDHFLLALDDLFSRYRPKVPKHLYSVAFVPIVDDDEAQFKPDDWLKTGSESEKSLRNVGHELRSSRYCWCDMFTLAAQEMGLIHRFYIIEIEFKSWKHNEMWSWPVADSDPPISVPLFVNESGKYFMRRNGMTCRLVDSDIAKLEFLEFGKNFKALQKFVPATEVEGEQDGGDTEPEEDDFSEEVEPGECDVYSEEGQPEECDSEPDNNSEEFGPDEEDDSEEAELDEIDDSEEAELDEEYFSYEEDNWVS